MRQVKWLAVGLVLIGLGGAAGCVSSAVPPEVSGAEKVANGQMTTLTGTEVLAMFNTAKALVASDPNTNFNNVTLTQAQADGIVEFIVANNLNSVEDVQALINDPGQIVIPPGLVELFANFTL